MSQILIAPKNFFQKELLLEHSKHLVMEVWELSWD